MFTKIHASVIVRIALVLVLLLGCFNAGAVKAETVEFAWAKQIAGTGTDLGIDLALDDAGNVYTVGYFNGTVDFDPGVGVVNSTSSGGNDIFISKLDTAGGYEWAQRIGSVGADYGNSIRLDANGNIYVTGAFEDMVDFDPGIGVSSLTSAGHTDIFIAKFNSAGEFLWAKRIGGAASDFGYGIAVDASGNTYTTGIFNGTVDFDPGAETLNLASVGSFDIFIMKLDTGGNFVWAENFGSTNQDEGWAIALDSAGNVFATGYFQDTVDFDPSEENIVEIASAGNTDIFLIGLDSNSGALRYIYTMGGMERDEGHDLVVEGNDLYLTGSFSGEADFDPGIDVVNLTSAGGTDAFISKFPIGGNWQWTKRVGGDGDDAGQDVSVRDGRIYTIGQFQGEADFDPNTNVYSLISAGVDDIFINTLDRSGNHLWTKQMGGSQSDVGFSISTNSTAIYTTGWFQGAADFDPNSGVNILSSAGSSDVFISKLPFASQRYYVKADAVGANDGTSWENAFTDLQSALFVSARGDEVWVAAGTYFPTVDGGPDISFVLSDGVQVYGGFIGNETSREQRDPALYETVLSGDINDPGYNGDNSHHVVTTNGVSDTTVLDGFTIRDGNAIIPIFGGVGGGMYNDHSNPTLANLTFRDNVAMGGGGMFNSDSDPALTHVTFVNNTATGTGGGMYNIRSDPSLVDVVFESNSADSSGGAIRNDQSSPTLREVIFIDNTSNTGGGIANAESRPVLRNVNFQNNTAWYGGGIWNSFGSNIDLEQATFEGNRAYAYGGGMQNSSNSTATLTNVTFTANITDSSTGGVIDNSTSTAVLTNVTISSNAGNGIHNASNSNVAIRNSIIWGSSRGQIVDESNSYSDVSYSIVENGYSGTGNLTQDPLLQGLANNGGFTQTMALDVDSSAINNGDLTNCPATDQRGVTRPQGIGCDIGAYEYVFSSVPTITTTATPTVSITPTSTLTFTPTATLTATHTPTLTRTSTLTPTPALTRTPTVTRTPTRTRTPSRTPSPTRTITSTSTPITPTATHTFTPHPPTITFTPSATATATDVVSAPAEMNKGFSPTIITSGGVSRLSVSIFNPNPFALTNAALTDNLPAGMTIANPASLSNSCGGTVTAVSGGTSVSLTGGSVPAQVGSTPGFCMVAIDVTSTTPGNIINTIPVGALVNDNGITNSTPTSATLTVLPVTATTSATRTATASGKPTKTNTPSRTPSPTRTPTYTLTSTRTHTPTLTPSSTHVTITATWTASPSRTLTPTWTPSPTTSSGFPTTVVRDNFNRANGTIGNTWYGYPSAFSIASNQLDVTASGSNTFILWKSSSFGADQEAYVTLTQIDATPGNEHRLILKSQNSKNVASGLISVVYDAASQTVQVWTYHPTQGWVQHGASISAAFVNGDQFGARARPDGTVEVYRNGMLLGTFNITSWPFYNSGGYVGMWFVNAPNALLDNFGGGTR